MVPVQTEDMKAGEPLRVCVERYCHLPVDKAELRGEADMKKALSTGGPV